MDNADTETMQKLTDALQKSDISFHNKIAILAALGYTHDVLNGKHGEATKQVASKEIGLAFVKKILLWRMETE